MNKKIGVFWIREDFRILKNSALAAATRNHDQVVAIYIFKKDLFNDREAQSWWIYKSLENYKSDLEKFNINLQILQANEYASVFKNLLKRNNFSIYWNKIYEPKYLKLDEKISKILISEKIDFKIFRGNILNEFDEVKKLDNTPFRVFTPYWRSAERVFLEKVPSPNVKIKKCKKITNLKCDDTNIQKIFSNKKWHSKFEANWIPSEQSALQRLRDFFNQKASNYAEGRDVPFNDGTSKLSPYIKNGQLHVETIFAESKKYKIEKHNLKKFLTEIGWREFNHSLINFFPHMLKENYSKKFDKFPWQKNKVLLNSWKKGNTGYPIVDAGMRELYETGWMHNRVRMIVGSFLVKHLLINWKEGESYFRNCLLDFSEANNIAGWQWVAGSGADAAPYFRIFNPILQGEKFDKNGDYVKKWIPKLKSIPKKFIHKPWEMNKDLQKSCDIEIGKDYPFPIVDHVKARQKALAAFKKI